MTALARILILVFCGIVAILVPAQAESASPNARALKQYLSPRVISELEWELLQFNLHWQGAFQQGVDYITSYPAFFDRKTMRFGVRFFVHEKRDINDADIFFNLPRAKRESVLRGAVDYFVQLLENSFPEVRGNPDLVYVEFLFRSSGGGSAIVAKYENGLLSLVD